MHDGMLLTTEGVVRSAFTEHSALVWILGQVLEFSKPKTFTESKVGSRNASYSWEFSLRLVAGLWDTTLLWASPPLPTN
jgi:hypothetical protein